MKIILLLISLLLVASQSFATTYMLIDSATKQIVSLSPEDDAVVGEGQEKIVLDKNYEDIKLEYPVQYYKYTNKKFVEDTKKLSDEENAKVKTQKRLEEENQIQLKAKKMAYEALKKEGKTFQEVKDTDFQK